MKRKILACVLACATLFLGMGYAYWTDSLQIDTTATTGELNVKFCDMAVYGQYGDEDNTWAIFDGIGNTGSTPFSPQMFFDRGNETNANGLYNIIATQEDLTAYNHRIEGYTKTSFGGGLTAPTTVVPTGADGNVYGSNTNVSDGINVSLTNMYPGYAQMFRTDIVNIGTLAARLADLQLTMNSATGENLDDMIGVSLKVLAEDNRTIKVLDPTADQCFYVGGVQFVRLSALEDVAITAGAGDDLLYIYPGVNTMDAIFGVAMDPDYAGSYTTGHVGITTEKNDADTQLENANFTIKFLWDQFNTPETAPAV